MFESFFKIIIVIFLVIILYSFIATILFRKRNRARKISFREIKKRREILSSFIICFISLILPYKVREFFILILNFLLHPIKEKFMLIGQVISRTFEMILFLLTYFIALPITIILKKIFKKERALDKYSNKHFDLLRRY